jgi:glycosyltransferase involved in cell wall biosynthesis
MKFSICIPNYNYGKFIGRTIRSVLEQDYDDFEIVVSDNASTDDSLAVVRAFEDPRIHVSVNRCNVGFAANLDRAAGRATGDFVLLLSSDDVLRPGALRTYADAFTALGDGASTTLLCSSCETIDEGDRVTGAIDLPGVGAWQPDDVDAALSSRLGVQTYRVEAQDMLRRCLLRMQNPFVFCSVAYARANYDSLEGYGANRMIGPDKRFHWRLLGRVDSAVLLRKPLFAYRVHSRNQLSQQQRSGALKYLVDEYLNVFETEATLLSKAGISRSELEQAFIEFDVVRHGMAQLSEGNRQFARRIIDFGKAAYPEQLRRNRHAWFFRCLVRLGPLGSRIASEIRKRYAGNGATSAR